MFTYINSYIFFLFHKEEVLDFIRNYLKAIKTIMDNFVHRDFYIEEG